MTMFSRLVAAVAAVALVGGAAAAQEPTVLPIPPRGGKAEAVEVPRVGFSATGKYVWAVVKGDPSRVVVFSAADRKPVADVTPEKALYLWDVAWTPDDARFALTVAKSSARGCEVYDAATGRRTHAVAFDKDVDVRRVRFTPDGRRVVVAAGGKGKAALVAYELAGGMTEAVAEVADDGSPIVDFAISLDGTQAAVIVGDRTGAATGRVKLYDLKARKLAAAFGPRSDDTFRLKYVAGGRLLATLQTTGDVRVWDLLNPAEPESSARIVTGVTRADVLAGGGFYASGDATTFAVTGPDRVAFAAADGKAAAGFRSDHFRSGADFSPDGTLLVTAGNAVRVWPLVPDKAAAPKRLVAVELARLTHHAWIVNMAAAPDGKRVSVFYNDCAYLFDDAGKLLGAAPKDLDRAGRGVDVAAGVLYRALRVPGTEGEHLIKVDLTTGEETVAAKPNDFRGFDPRFDKRPDEIEFRKPVFTAPGGKSHVLAIGNRGDYLVDANFKKLADLTDAKVEYSITPRLDKAVPVFTPDGRTVWVKKSSGGDWFVPYDTATGKEGEPVKGAYDAYAVAAAANGKALFGILEKSGGGTIIWRLDVKSQEYDRPFSRYDSASRTRVTALAFAAAADVVAVAEDTNAIRVLNAVTGRELATATAPDFVGKLALSADGKTLFAHAGPRGGEKASVLLKYTLK